MALPRMRRPASAGDDNHLFFEFGARLLITRKLTGNFPDYDRVLPQDNTNIATVSKDEAKAAIERVAQFADERSRAIRVQFAAGEIRIFASSLETGESEESVPAEYTGPELEIGFNAQYLLDFLRAVPQEQVSFSLKDQKSAGELQPPALSTRRISLCCHAHAHLTATDRHWRQHETLRVRFFDLTIFDYLWQMKQR